MTPRHLLRCGALLALLCTTACHTPSAAVTPAAGGAMRDDAQPEWTRALDKGLLFEEIPLDARTFSFDVWHIEGASQIEPLWMSIHPLLNLLVTLTQDAALRAGLLALMSQLEPDAIDQTHPVQLEVSFLSSPTPEAQSWREGIALRLWRDLPEHTPTLTLVIWRDPDTASLSQVQLWTHPGIRDAAATASLDERQVTLRPGTLPFPLPTPAPNLERAPVTPDFLALVDATLWEPFTQDRYLEPTWQLSPTPAIPPAALRPQLGLAHHERDLEQLATQTSFPPKIDLDDAFAPREDTPL